jgi:hypothetical protein
LIYRRCGISTFVREKVLALPDATHTKLKVGWRKKQKKKKKKKEEGKERKVVGMIGGG